jgi:hypothetical protein
MMSFRGQASWGKMTLPGGKLRALACHQTKNVNKAELEFHFWFRLGWFSIINNLIII